MNILITGASRGLGAALAADFAAKTKGNIILASRNENRLNELKNTIETKNPDTLVLVRAVDLTSEDDLDQFISWVRQQIPSLDILVNNAGLLMNEPFGDMEKMKAEAIFRINYFAPAMLIRGVDSLLRKADHAHVVNIGSMGGYQGSVKFTGLSHYSASKAALAVLTECLAEEYKEAGISFNCLALGAVQTEMLDEAFPGYKSLLSAAEMAGFVSDFALNGHRFMNGKILPVALSTP